MPAERPGMIALSGYRWDEGNQQCMGEEIRWQRNLFADLDPVEQA